MNITLYKIQLFEVTKKNQLFITLSFSKLNSTLLPLVAVRCRYLQVDVMWEST